MRKPIYYFVLMAIAFIPGKIFVLMAKSSFTGRSAHHRAAFSFLLRKRLLKVQPVWRARYSFLL